MTFSIDRSSAVPYYAQVRDTIQAHIQSGRWTAGDQLPGEPELCRMFDVSRTVIRQALNDLAYRGLIVREKGKGTFVAQPKITESLVQKLTGFYQDMVEQGHTPVTRILNQQRVPASPKVATYLKIEGGASVIQIERLRFVDDVPIQLVTTYLPYDLCPGVLEADLSNQSLYGFLERECGLWIAHGSRMVEAVPANEYESELLQVRKGSPLILLDSVSFLDNGVPVEYYHALHRGDRTRFQVELVRVRDPGSRQTVLDHELSRMEVEGGFVLRHNPTPDT